MLRNLVGAGGVVAERRLSFNEAAASMLRNLAPPISNDAPQNSFNEAAASMLRNLCLKK